MSQLPFVLAEGRDKDGDRESRYERSNMDLVIFAGALVTQQCHFTAKLSFDSRFLSVCSLYFMLILCGFQPAVVVSLHSCAFFCCPHTVQSGTGGITGRCKRLETSQALQLVKRKKETSCTLPMCDLDSPTGFGL